MNFDGITFFNETYSQKKPPTQTTNFRRYQFGDPTQITQETYAGQRYSSNRIITLQNGSLIESRKQTHASRDNNYNSNNDPAHKTLENKL